MIITADDLLLGCLAADFIVADTVPGHIDTHISWRFVRTTSVDALKYCTKYRKNLYVTIVVDCGFSICFQMERINHVDIVQIGRRSLIGKIDWMFERYVPDRKCLKFRISSVDSAFVFVIELGEACRHLAASRCDNNQGASGFNIIILTVSFVTDDQWYIGRIPFYHIMNINFNSHLFQTSFEQMCTVLTGILRDYNTSYIEAVFFKGVLQTQNVRVIRDPQITAYFVCFYVGSAYDDDDLGSI